MTIIYSANKTNVLVPIGCPETSVSNYHYLLRNKPEERRSPLLSYGKFLEGRSSFCRPGRRVIKMASLDKNCELENIMFWISLYSAQEFKICEALKSKFFI
jgi:hypothetical protein